MAKAKPAAFRGLIPDRLGRVTVYELETERWVQKHPIDAREMLDRRPRLAALTEVKPVIMKHPDRGEARVHPDDVAAMRRDGWEPRDAADKGSSSDDGLPWAIPEDVEPLLGMSKAGDDATAAIMRELCEFAFPADVFASLLAERNAKSLAKVAKADRPALHEAMVAYVKSQEAAEREQAAAEQQAQQ